MTNCRQPLHLVRSIVARNWLQTQGWNWDEVIATFDEQKLFDSGVLTRRALRSWWRGQRPLRFDPPGQGTTSSEVQVLTDTFEGFGYVFFHPLFNLLAHPLRSSEAYRARHAFFAAELMHGELLVSRTGASEDRDLALARWTHMRRVNARAALAHRRRENKTPGPAASLRGVLEALMQLRSPLRDELMRPSRFDAKEIGVAATHWARRSRTMDEELAALLRAPRLDRLAAAVGLAMEAAHTGCEERWFVLVDFLRRESMELKRDDLFASMATPVALLIRLLPPCPKLLEIDMVEAQLAALPQSWADRLLA